MSIHSVELLLVNMAQVKVQPRYTEPQIRYEDISSLCSTNDWQNQMPNVPQESQSLDNKAVNVRSATVTLNVHENELFTNAVHAWLTRQAAHTQKKYYQRWRRLVNAYEVKADMVCLQCKNCVIHAWALQRWVYYDGALYKSLYLLPF